MKKYISPFMLFTAALLWGIAFVAQKAATELPTFTLLFSRNVIAVLVLIPIIILFDKFSQNGRKLISFRNKKIDISKRELIAGFVCGIFLFSASALQQAGIADTDTGKASFITALYVVIVPIYALFFGKKSPLNAWIGIIIAMIGFYLLCISDGFKITGADFLVLLCAFVFAMQIMAVDLMLPGCDGIRLSIVQFATVAVLSFASALIFEMPLAFSSMLNVIPEILYLGIVSSGVAYTLQILGQKDTPPAIASILLSLESVFGALFAAIMLSERMSPKEYVGCAIVLLAVIISELDFKTILSKLGKKSKS